MKQRRVFVCVLLFAVFLSVLLPDGGLASLELPPEGWTGIYGRADLEKISLTPDGQYILMNDIDLTGAPWTGLCSEDFPFTGTLDGNGFSVYGMDASSQTSAAGLFSYVAGGTVKNLSVAGSVCGPLAGLLVGKADSAILIQCSAQGSVSAFFCAGGLVGQLSGEGSRLEGCLWDGTVAVIPPAPPTSPEEIEPITESEPDLAEESFLGGLVGAVYGADVSILSCESAGQLSFSGARVIAGGLVGLLEANASISRCGTEGNLSLAVTDYGALGGLVGKTGTFAVSLTDGVFRGDWTVPSCAGSVDFGGIVGLVAALEDVTVEGCTVFGSMSSAAASARMGGIVGASLAVEASATVRRCSSFARLSASGAPLDLGGICGVNRGDGGTARIENCHGDGSVTHSEAPIRDPSLSFGGICGSNGGTGVSEISLCFSSCDMNITYPLTDGAVVGINYPHAETGTAIVERCYYRHGAREYFAQSIEGAALSDPSSYVGFDFDRVWRMDESFALPLLRTEEPSSEVLPLGDVDGNRRITRYDGLLLMQYLTGRTELSDPQRLRADINGDGTLDAQDVSLILRNAM